MFIKPRIGLGIGIKAKIISKAFDQILNQSVTHMELTASQSHVLGYIASAESPVCQSDIEKAFNIKRSTAIGILQRLEEKEFIRSVSDENDKRYKRIVPTPKAVDVMRQISDSIIKTEENLLKSLSEEEVGTFIALLDKIILDLPCTNCFAEDDPTGKGGIN